MAGYIWGTMAGHIWGESPRKAVQIVKKNEKTGSFELASKAMEKLLVEKLLLDDKVKDKKVCIISVAGAFRKGKSFVLNFFVKYLEQACEREDDLGNWLGKDGDEIAGFPWRGGSERETTGIWAWNKVFILRKTMESNTDTGVSLKGRSEEIAVILLDTQGTFDSDSSTKENIAVFALAALISSTLVFNLSQNIQENDLQYLQLFAEYGKQAAQAQTVTTDKPFQSLMFLVRDWPYPTEKPYGLIGGKTFLQGKLAVSDRQHSDLRDVREGIKECFDHLDCCLLPYPGSKVATGSARTMSDVDSEFKDHVKRFVESVSSISDSPVIKKIDGREITCGELVSYVKSYVEAFQDEGIPSATTLLQTTAKAHHLVAIEHAKSYFMKEIKKVCGADMSYMDPTELDLKLQDIKVNAKATFRDQRKVGSTASMNEEYQGMLSNFMIETCREYTQANKNKANVFVKTMVLISYIFYPITSLATFVKIQGWFHRRSVEISSFCSSVSESIGRLWSRVADHIENSEWMPNLPDLGIRKKMLSAVNAVCVPLTLMFIMVIFKILSACLGGVGLSEYSIYFNFIVLAAFITMCLWIYLAFSGHLPALKQAIDTVVASIWQSAPAQRRQPVAHYETRQITGDSDGRNSLEHHGVERRERQHID